MWWADTDSQTCPRSLEFQWRHDSEQLCLLRNLVIFELVFFISYKSAMSMSPRSGAPFWLPDSVLLCALLLSRPRTWWIFLVAPLPLRLFVGLPPDAPMWFLLAAFLNDSLKAVVAAALLRRVLPGRPFRFDCLHDFWVYLTAAVVAAPALSGVAGAASWVALGGEFWPTWRNWFSGDALANVVFTPLLLCLAADWRKLAAANPLRHLEGFALISGLVFVIELGYHRGLNNPNLIDLYDYIPVVLLLLAAIRFGPVGASGALTVMSLLSVAATSGSQPNSSVPAPMDSVLSMQLFLIVIGIPIMSLAVLREQQLRAELSLRESESRFRNMADTAPVMIWVSGPDKLVTFFNKGWLNFTGRTMELQLGSGWTASVHPEELDRVYATYSSSFDARRIYQMEHRLRRADGEYRWVLCTGVPRVETDGVFAGYIGSCIDITEQKRAEATLRQSLDEIAHMNRVAAMGELTASIAHEVNQPLAAILSNAQAANRFLGGESPDLAQVRECLTAIVADDKRAGEVIRRLRGLLKRGASQPSLVDLNEVVSDAIRLLGNDAILRNVSVKVEPFPGLPAALGDRIQLYQLALNLIMNGLDAVAERSPGDRWVLVRTAEADGGGVELTVEDSGSGVAASDLARVFEPFFSTKREGLGMGLSISRSIVQAHGGKIWAENAVGGGAIFRCVLPAPQQTVASTVR